MRKWIKQFFSSPEKSEQIPNTPHNAMNADAALQPLDQIGASAKYKAEGDSHLHGGDFAAAVHCYRQAIALDPDNAKALCNLGFALKEQGQFDAAAQVVTRALAIDATIVDAQYLMGVLSQATGKPDEALAHFHKTLELAPDFEIAYCDLCFLLFQLGRLEEARHVVMQGVVHIADSADLHFYLGNLYHAEQQFDLAATSFEHALLIQPERADVLTNLGLALLAKGDPAQAAAAFQKALAIAPISADMLCNLGYALHRQNQYDDAIIRYRNALAINPQHVDAHFNLGNALQMQNKTAEAIACYRAVLAINPQHISAQNNLGSALRTSGNLKEALICYDRLLANNPDSADAHCNAGVVLTDLGQFDDAMSSLRRALEIKPDFAEAHSSLGNALLALGQVDQAVASYRRALEIKPNFTDAHYRLGRALHDLGKLDDAHASYRRALEIDPDYVDAHINLAKTLKDLGRFDDAVASATRALQIKPDFAEGHGILGDILQGMGKPVEAVASYQRALEINPDFVEALCNMAFALHDLGKLEEAVASDRRALKIKPNHAKAHCHLSNVLKDLKQFDDAIISARRVLEIEPDFAEGHSNLGAVLFTQGNPDEAIACYRRALEIDGDFATARSALLFILNFLPNQSATDLLAEAQRYGEWAERQARPYRDWQCIRSVDRCLRVGFVSGDFRNHPVGYYLENVLKALKEVAAGQLELIAYSNHFSDDAVTDHIQACCHLWRNIAGLSDELVARRIHEDGVDILIDLSGHTAHNRLPLFAWKPAPVQATWLGYFPTTGVAAIDYRIADPWVPPQAEEAGFTESIYRLPETYVCFTPPNRDIQVSALPALVNGYVTFGSFNNLAKINDTVVALWARILHAVDGSCLFLKTNQLTSPGARQVMIARFAAQGIEANRLILEGSSPRAEHLAAYQRVDIALDPFPLPGGTTSVEALWMGAPLLTLVGNHFLSRIGESTLQNAGLPEWIAFSADEYVERAVSHARDVDRLAALRNGLRQQVLDSPLFDAPRFASNFKAAMRDMWTKWCNQPQNPESIH